MNPTQEKMARAAVGWGVRDLSKFADVGTSTITRFEAGENINLKSYEAMKETLAKAGVTFLEDDGSGPGVRYKPAANPL